MVQAFRREESNESAKDLPLRGIDPAATHEVTNLDVKTSATVAGKDLMQHGLHVEIAGKRGAAIILYKKVR